MKYKIYIKIIYLYEFKFYNTILIPIIKKLIYYLVKLLIKYNYKVMIFIVIPVLIKLQKTLS